MAIRIKPLWLQLWEKALHAPESLVRHFSAKCRDLRFAFRHRAYRVRIAPRGDDAKAVRKEWMWTIRTNRSLGSNAYGRIEESALSAEEKLAVSRIRSKRSDSNRNNITRTEAYLRFYRSHPEVHWALLAHMVSRNGGWNMTDLKGEWLPRIMEETYAEDVFRFLEEANYTIFNDAFAQLLLFEESERLGRPLFHLLPFFNVSAFMRPVWDQFWETRDSVLLTIALIINEQNVVEQRSVSRKLWQQRVLQTPLFLTQSLMQLNQVFFPFHGESGERHLAGLTLEWFRDVHERIEVGKRLYALLFGIESVNSGVLRFALNTPHTGSRADYWPHLFTRAKTASPRSYTERLDGDRLMQGAGPLYSPALSDAWPDIEHREQDADDWFQDRTMVKHLGSARPPLAFEMTGTYVRSLSEIELAIMAESAVH